MADYPLVGLGLKIKAHWKKYRPRMYAELEKSGHLEQSVYEAQERTSDLMDDLLTKGFDYHRPGSWRGRSGRSSRASWTSWT